MESTILKQIEHTEIVFKALNWTLPFGNYDVVVKLSCN